MSQVCKHCGQAIEEGARFCANCGKPAEVSGQVPPNGVQMNPGQVPPNGVQMNPGQMPPNGVQMNPGQMPPNGMQRNPGQVPPSGMQGNPGQMPPGGVQRNPGQMLPNGMQMNPGQVPPGAPYVGPVSSVPGQEKKPERRGIPKKVWIPVVSFLILLLAGCGTLFFIRSQSYREDIAAFEKRMASYQLGNLKGEYDGTLAAAQEVADKYQFWKYKEEKHNLDDLKTKIIQMNEEVKEYREKYEEIVKNLETSGKYFLDDHEEEYQKLKEELTDALDRFDATSCVYLVSDFDQIGKKIIEENKSAGKEWKESSSESVDSWEGCEQYLLSQKKKEIDQNYSSGQYKKEKEAYENFEKLSEKFQDVWNTDQVVQEFSQADVSTKGKIQLYFQAEDDDFQWNLSDFTIYEEVGKTWKECEPVDITQVRDKGDLSIDLVADVSTSMEDVFGTMQSAVGDFVDSVNPNVRLGLSELSSVYTRKRGFTTDSSSIRDSVYSLECHGCTALYDSLYSSVVDTAREKGARCVIAFTDGVNEPYDSARDCTEQDVIDIAQKYKVPIYLFGIGSNIAGDILNEIASETGGYYENLSWSDVSSMDEYYDRIYETQMAMYQLTYRSALQDNSERTVYINYYNQDQDVSMRMLENIDVSTLASAYSEVSASDPASYYTAKYALSAEDLEALKDEYGIEGIQTVINLYYLKNGYQFGTKYGPIALEELEKICGPVKNGTHSDTYAENRIQKHKQLHKNFNMLYRYRDSLIYNTMYGIFDQYSSKADILEATCDELNIQMYNRERFKKNILPSSYKKVKKEMKELY